MTNLRLWVLAALALTLSSLATAQVRISEIHYDNAGTDAGEAIEVSAPAGTDLTGWQVVLYNGNGGASYDSDFLPGVVPATCGARGVLVISYPANGIQNGDPDGIALVDGTGAVVEYLSYEGTFAATNGPAAGLTSTDLGVREAGTEVAGNSLARDATGAWSGPATHTFGACNDAGEEPPPAEVAVVTVAPPASNLNVGSTLALTATAFDSNGAPIGGTTFAWTSSNPGAATVSASGVVSGVAEGDTTVFATAPNGIAGSATVHVTTPTTLPPSDIRFNEIHYDNAGTDVGEAIEIDAPAGTDLTGFSIVLYDGNGGGTYGTPVTLSGVVPATCGARGVVVIGFPVNGLQNGSPDGLALLNADGNVLEFLSYEGVLLATGGPASGLTSTDIVAVENGPPIGSSLQRDPELPANWTLTAASSFGACNPGGSTPAGNSLSFSGRVPTDPALPVGYEDQIFATLRDPGNVTIPTTITWTSETPSIATINAAGVIRALTAGTATFRATAAEGTTATYSLPTHVAVASGVSYPGNAEFGEPTDADASDDIIVRHEQFTASYNPNRGSPNWVSYDLDVAHFGPEDRCDCFTMDPDLPASLPQISTDDYTGAGAFHGYGIDRGHMVRSFDRTTGSLDNARTYLFSNVVPQAADMNQGPWANLENYFGDLARLQGREVYIITGPAGNRGTLKNLGRVVIPASTWKVAVILPHDQGLAHISDYRDVEVIAVNMPNDAGIRNVDWNTYRTTVDAIEALSGYDLLALLPDDVEAAVESGTQPPLASVTGPAGAIAEGDTAAFSAAASLDPNGTVASYAWDFGDGSSGSGVNVTHTFVQDGAFTVR
ncbi:MAG: DNA/RNA non-specific endonuclease, partial [Luteibacter sp.]